MVLIIWKITSLFLIIGLILRSSILLKVEFILCINDSVLVGIHHLEQELRLAISDLKISDFLNCLLELSLHIEGLKRIMLNNENLLDPFSEDVMFQVVNIGEEVFQESEALSTAGVCFQLVIPGQIGKEVLKSTSCYF